MPRVMKTTGPCAEEQANDLAGECQEEQGAKDLASLTPYIMNVELQAVTALLPCRHQASQSLWQNMDQTVESQHATVQPPCARTEHTRELKERERPTEKGLGM